MLQGQGQDQTGGRHGLAYIVPSDMLSGLNTEHLFMNICSNNIHLQPLSFIISINYLYQNWSETKINSLHIQRR